MCSGCAGPDAPAHTNHRRAALPVLPVPDDKPELPEGVLTCITHAATSLTPRASCLSLTRGWICRGGTRSRLPASGMYNHRWVGTLRRHTPRQVTTESPLRDMRDEHVVTACTPSAKGSEADRHGQTEGAAEVCQQSHYAVCEGQPVCLQHRAVLQELPCMRDPHADSERRALGRQGCM